MVAWADQEGGRGSRLPGKSQAAIGFLGNTGTNPPPLEKQLGPLGPIASGWRFVRPSMIALG